MSHKYMNQSPELLTVNKQNQEAIIQFIQENPILLRIPNSVPGLHFGYICWVSRTKPKLMPIEVEAFRQFMKAQGLKPIKAYIYGRKRTVYLIDSPLEELRIIKEMLPSKPSKRSKH